MSRIDERKAAIFQSDALSKTWKIRGSPRASIAVESHKGPMQLVAYVYDVDRRNIGTLITQGVISRREGKAEASKLTWDLNIAAYDIPEGHSVALVFDTVDPLYEIPKAGRYSLTLENSAELELPVTL
jgi:predicted acyl esterase